MEKSQIPVLNVSDFIASINQTFEYAYSSVGIEGEVMGFKVNQGKFVFFDIKDEQGSIGCFMTVWQLRMPIEDGMKVIVTGMPKLTPWGKFSITVQAVRPSGEGNLKKSFELLKSKLNKEGLFAPDRKRTLPHIPQHIAVISSTQAAGYADFIKILNERWSGVRVDVAHVQVQGADSADQIIRALQYFNALSDLPEVLVIVRGGGSADDLSTFNDEQLVRSVASSRIPVLTGIGHEIDESLVDLAADVRASTPSNAAQIVVPDKKEIIRRVNNGLKGITTHVLQKISSDEQNVDRQILRAIEAAEGSIERYSQNTSRLSDILSAYDPIKVLARGYAVVRGEEMIGKTITIEKWKTIIKAEVKDVQAR